MRITYRRTAIDVYAYFLFSTPQPVRSLQFESYGMSSIGERIYIELGDCRDNTILVGSPGEFTYGLLAVCSSLKGNVISTVGLNRAPTRPNTVSVDGNGKDRRVGSFHD